MAAKRVEIIEKKEIFRRLFFRIEEARLRHETLSGTMSEEMVRLNLKRGDGVAVLLHDPQAATVVMVEQFRYAAYENGPGWLLEIPAGIVQEGEDPAEGMKREIEEETGYRVAELQHITTFYLSPGGSSERIWLYYAAVSPKDRITEGGGLPVEQEEIRVAVYPVAALVEKAASGEIQDAKTLVGLQWLQLNRLDAGR